MTYVDPSFVMARLDRATHSARVCALVESCHQLGGPLLRAMTPLELEAAE